MCSAIWSSNNQYSLELRYNQTHVDTPWHSARRRAVCFAFLHEETDRLGDRPNSSDGRTLLRGVSPPELVAFCPCTPENLFFTLTLERRRNTKTNAPPTPFCVTKWVEWKQELSLWLTPKRRHNHLTCSSMRRAVCLSSWRQTQQLSWADSSPSCQPNWAGGQKIFFVHASLKIYLKNMGRTHTDFGAVSHCTSEMRNTKTNASPTPFCATKWAGWKQEP